MSKVDIINAVLDAAKQRRKEHSCSMDGVRCVFAAEDEKLLTSAVMEAYKRGETNGEER